MEESAQLVDGVLGQRVVLPWNQLGNVLPELAGKQFQLSGGFLVLSLAGPERALMPREMKKNAAFITR